MCNFIRLIKMFNHFQNAGNFKFGIKVGLYVSKDKGKIMKTVMFYWVNPESQV